MSPRDDEPRPLSDAFDTEGTVCTPADSISATSVNPPGSEGAASGSSTLAVSELLAGRYEVVRFLARGGMGEVYEVEDRELHERVALKTILPDLATDSRLLERFKREIQLARRISHPNVCRLFEFGRHRLSTGPGAGREVLFLTMELLSGETLRDRIRRHGKLSPEQALPIVAQLAAALDAAHRHDIVHRDFKSGNVMIVPDKGAERAVVTDFGLARTLAPQDTAMTRQGDVLGTPDYMAPEQVKGEEAGAAADIYALGVVAYEMVTGTLPFRAQTPMATALRRLSEKPPSPRSVVPGLGPAWETAILRCLERAPEDRFARASEMVEVLTGGRIETPTRWRRWAIAAAVGAAISVALLGFRPWSWLLRSPAVEAPGARPAAAERASLAVLGFKNLGDPDLAWLSTAAAEMLRTELGAGGQLRTVPGESVARVKMELNLADADSLAPDTLQRLHSILGADYVVLGSLIAQGAAGGSRVRLDARVQETRTGELIVQLPETGTEAELFELVGRVGRRLREELDLAPLSTALAAGLRATMPANPEAARLYAEGLAKLRVLDALSARDLLQKAAAVEPGHPMIHSALAAAWSELGYEATAREEAQLAFSTSAQLPEEERLEVEGRLHELRGEWDEAIAAFGELRAELPESIDNGVRLAAVQIAAGRPDDALVTLSELRRLPDPAGKDPRLDLTEAVAAKALTDFERQRTAAASAAARSKELGAHLLFAQARQSECDALVALGRVAEGREACAEARTIFSATGDGGGAARTENIVAVSFAREGDLDSAAAGFRRALEESRRIGNRRGVATQLNNLGNVLSFQGDLDSAKRSYLDAKETFGEIGDRLNMALALTNVAAVLWDQGELDAALAASREALPIFREAGANQHLARALFNIGEVLHAKGEITAARESYAESLALFRSLESPGDIADALLGLARVFRDEGDREQARNLLEEARQFFVADENEEGAAEAAAELAKL